MQQTVALAILKTGTNVFLTGEPGAGKSYVVNQYTNWLRQTGIPFAVTASTGIAATHIGGATIHSWSGIGTRDSLSEYDLDTILSKEYLVKRIKKTAALIIDEISMLDGNMLDMLDKIFKHARGSSEPFGGIQVVFVGDFFQLPPIRKNSPDSNYAFQSEAWKKASLAVCYLSEQYRHDDSLLSELLRSIRDNSVEEAHYTLLGEQKDIEYENIEPTRLFTHNANVDQLNLQELQKLPGQKRQYTMKSTGNKLLVETLKRSCLSPEKLILTEETMVMCTKNNFEAGYANGTLGRVVRFEKETGLPVILTSEGKEIVMTPATWSIQDNGKTLAEVEQIPLRLAWAITIHKSQGMSLDAAEIDLANTFTFGQGYVALSRVKSLAGLKLNGINANALLVDPFIVENDKLFKKTAQEIDSAYAAKANEDLISQQKEFVKRTGKRWVAEGEKVEDTPTKTQSTYEITAELLLNHQDFTSIAKTREMTLGTIINHVETLLESNPTIKSSVKTIIEQQTTPETRTHIQTAIEQYGDEKLKPLYEACNGEYDYVTIRLARIYSKLAVDK